MPHTKLFIPGPIEVSPKTFAAFCKPMIGHRSNDFKTLYAAIQPQTTGASVSITGKLVASQGQGQKWEVTADAVAMALMPDLPEAVDRMSRRREPTADPHAEA